VLTVVATDGHSEEELLRLTGAVEKSSEHPLAAAIVDGATRAGSCCPPSSRSRRHGIEARVDGQAALAMSFSSVTVIANANRLRRWKPRLASEVLA
jgi:Cu+-exporting ATPase